MEKINLKNRGKFQKIGKLIKLENNQLKEREKSNLKNEEKIS